MLLPIGDDNTGRTTTPFINYILIAVNVFVFIFLQGMGSNDEFTYAFSTVPEEIVTGQDIATGERLIEDPETGETFSVLGLQETPILVYLTLLTSMFMHGGFAHLFGNMLYLWIFGDNIEDSLGHLRYLVFYIVCGVLASLAHVISSVIFGENMLIPSLGASGAISGVLGGYLVLHPKRKVKVIFLRSVKYVSALVAIGVWFLFQLISSIGVIGQGSGGGVAYAAHIGGFIVGLILIKFFAIGRKKQILQAS